MPNSLTKDHERIAACLEPDCLPAVLFNRAYRQAVAASGAGDRLTIAIERNDGLVSRADLDLLPGGSREADTRKFVERHLKFLLWSQGGWKVYLHGPTSVTTAIEHAYSPGGTRGFDADLMRRVYDRNFAVTICASADDVPEPKSLPMPVGGHLDGCRIGFDLGASDYKLAAVKDGEPVFATEIPWDPVPQDDPDYHYQRISEGLKMAAEKLPRVDAIGGSSAGIYVANRVKVASLFRGIAPKVFEQRVKGMFLRLREEWGVPLEVCNDGDVTALAGAMSLGCNGLLGIAMGSSEAVGYIDGQGRITGWLNELAFAPVDFNPGAAPDEWSGDVGVGALYFSQQAVAKLAPLANIPLPAEMPFPERLKEVQKLADNGDERALRVFSTIGTYLGYTLPHYRDYYDFGNVLLLGRVTSGRGGELILSTAKATLAEVFPEVNESLEIHVPDEKSRRVGQAVAAASLPELGA